MFEKIMRQLGWVRRSELQKLLAQHVSLLDEHEKMIRIAQMLLKESDAKATSPKQEGAVAAPSREPSGKLH